VYVCIHGGEEVCKTDDNPRPHTKTPGGKEAQKEDTTEGAVCKYPCHTGRKEYHQKTET